MSQNVNQYTDYQPQTHYDPIEIEKILKYSGFINFIRYPAYTKAVFKFVKISFIFIKLFFYTWYDSKKWTYLIDWIKTGNVELAESKRLHKRAKWIRNKILENGPTFIKIGQSLSTRVDLLKREYIEELSKLQDQVPPFSSDKVAKILEEELGKNYLDHFNTIDMNPLASASLGQVHHATLKTGEEVAIKIQRPHLIDLVQLDLAILRKLAKLCQTFFKFARNRNWVQIVDEFGKTLLEETDYILEAQNAERFKENFASQDYIKIPTVYWTYVTSKVITLEYIPGIKIDNIEAIDQANLDRKLLAKRCIEIYLQQLLLDGFYHADPHPGNIAISQEGKIIFYDFGMVGRIASPTKYKMVNAFMNIVHKKPDQLIDNLISLDMLEKNADIPKIKSMIKWSLNHFYSVPYDQVKFETITDDLADLMYQFPFKLPASFTYIVRALITLEGISIRLNPKLSFLEIAVPYAKKYLAQTAIQDIINASETDIIDILVDKVYQWTGLKLFKKESDEAEEKEIRVRLDREDIEVVQKQLLNGFGVIGFGIFLSMFFSMFTLIILLIHNKIITYILLAIMIMTIPMYFVIMLGILLTHPKRPKEILRKHLTERHQFFQ